MPLYTVMTQDGVLSAEQRDVIAAELVRIHTAAMNVPAHFVHSIFPTYPRIHAYAAESECGQLLIVVDAASCMLGLVEEVGRHLEILHQGVKLIDSVTWCRDLLPHL